VKRWESGGVDVDVRLYIANSENTFLEEITDSLIDGSVNWNQDRDAGVKLTADLVLDRKDFVPYSDWLAPVVTLTWADGVVESGQMGLFLCGIPDGEVDQDHAVIELSGFDPTYRLWNSMIRDTLNASLGQNRIEFLEDVFLSVGINRFSFEDSASTFDADRSWWPGSRLYQVASEVLEPMGWYYPYPDMGGNIRSRAYVDLERETPILSIDSSDPLEPLSVVPTVETLANIIVVKKSGVADEAPLIGFAENDDPNSPISTANSEPIVREISVNDIETQEEADAIAHEYLVEAGSFFQVVSMSIAPTTVLGPYQVIDLAYDSEEWGCLCGRYRLREFEVPLGVEGDIEIECNRVMEFSHE
jgi:hypothetical protein